MAYDTAIAALADPTRRALVERLRAGPQPVGVLADDLPISRPAVSQHLKVLSDAGLLEVEPQGARRLYRLAPRGLDELRAYLDGLWDDALSSFAARAREVAKGS
ncbi:MAG: metalloregulator ArsR/SmtB family transcription factor [Rhodobacter sp.]|nr:metalloregulator ArsR/SmtB family transcription factor [Rhodobacter sp.]